jgi:chromosome segregation ATPase
MDAGISPVCQKKGGFMATEVALSQESREAEERVRQLRKHSVAWLERELAEARKDLQLAGERIDAINIQLTETRETAGCQIRGLQEMLVKSEDALMQKNDALTQVFNERDEARDERDFAKAELNRVNRDKDELLCRMVDTSIKNKEREGELCKDLRRIQEAHIQLTETNRRNFDKANRHSDVAAVLVSCLVAVTGEDPVGTMSRIVVVAGQMGVSLEKCLNEVETTLKRGSNARVEQAMNLALGDVREPLDLVEFLDRLPELEIAIR